MGKTEGRKKESIKSIEKTGASCTPKVQLKLGNFFWQDRLDLKQIYFRNVLELGVEKDDN